METLRRTLWSLKAIFSVLTIVILIALIWYNDHNKLKKVEHCIEKYNRQEISAAEVFKELKSANNFLRPFLFIPGKKTLFGKIPHWSGSAMIYQAYEKFEEIILTEELAQICSNSQFANSEKIEYEEVIGQIRGKLDSCLNYIEKIRSVILKTKDAQRKKRLQNLIWEARRCAAIFVETGIRRIWIGAKTLNITTVPTIHSKIDELSPVLEKILNSRDEFDNEEDNGNYGGIGEVEKEESGAPGGAGRVGREELGTPEGTGKVGRKGFGIPGGIGKVSEKEPGIPGGTAKIVQLMLSSSDSTIQRIGQRAEQADREGRCNSWFEQYKNISANASADYKPQFELISKIFLECDEVLSDKNIKSELRRTAGLWDDLIGKTLSSITGENILQATERPVELVQAYLLHCNERRTLRIPCSYQKRAKGFIEWNNSLNNDYFINKVLIEIPKRKSNSFIRWEPISYQVSDGWSNRTVHDIKYLQPGGSVEIYINNQLAFRRIFIETDRNQNNIYCEASFEQGISWKPGDNVSIKVYNTKSGEERNWRNDEYYSLLNLEGRWAWLYSGNDVDVKIYLSGLSIPNIPSGNLL